MFRTILAGTILAALTACGSATVASNQSTPNPTDPPTAAPTPVPFANACQLVTNFTDGSVLYEFVDGGGVAACNTLKSLHDQADAASPPAIIASDRVEAGEGTNDPNAAVDCHGTLANGLGVVVSHVGGLAGAAASGDCAVVKPPTAA